MRVGQGRQARGVFHVKGASVCVEGQEMVGLGLLEVSSWWLKGNTGECPEHWVKEALVSSWWHHWVNMGYLFLGKEESWRCVGDPSPSPR